MKPTTYTLTPPWLSWPETLRLLAAFPKAHETMRFVGGCVRDAMRGLHTDTVDIDLATTFTPQAVIDLLEDAEIRMVPHGLAHGTVMAIVDKRTFEITTLRADIETYGRHAKVLYTTDWMEDARRRDFTFNALYLSPDGTLYDPWGGLADLHAGLVRFIGDADARVQEDYLRILRYFRFHGVLESQTYDKAALKACTRFAPRVADLSVERILRELLKLLDTKTPAGVLKTMAQTGVLDVIFEAAVPLETLGALEALETRHQISPHALRRFAALTSPFEAEDLKRRFKLSLKETQYLEAVRAPLPTTLPALFYAHNDTAIDAILLHTAMGQEAPPLESAIAFARTWVRPLFPLTGRDLTALGIAPGPRLGDLLRRAEQFWIAESFRLSHDECCAYITKLIEGDEC